MKENQLRILVITVASWNSKVGSNTWTSLLKNYDSKNIANICIRDEIPDNQICSRYFAISENKVMKSILKRNLKTGREIVHEISENKEKDLDVHNVRYQKMQKKRRYSLLLAREVVWKLGKWKTAELDVFLDDFKPDIILHSMEGYIHLNRIIQYAIKRTGAKAIGYIWDDNFTYKQSSKIGYKVYRFFQRRSLKKLASMTDAFFAISEKTKNEADAYFNISSQLLTKPLNAIPKVEFKEIEHPIHILYTGNLLIGRDRSLLRVVNAIKRLPPNSFVVDVYTQTSLSNSMLEQLDNDICNVFAPVAQSEVLKKQKETDILLFLEDIDGPDAKVARLSFSTKITDYLSAGKAIIAVGCNDTAPISYFADNRAAFTAANDEEIYEILLKILNEPSCLFEMAVNAGECGLKNHSAENIQKIFDNTIDKVYRSRAIQKGYESFTN